MAKESLLVGPVLTVAAILRQCVCGAVFVLAYCYAKNPSSPSSHLKQINDNIYAVVFIALLFGILIYSFHRAIANIVIELVRDKALKVLKKSTGPVPKFLKRIIAPERILRLSGRRWMYLAQVKEFHSHVTDWGDYVHLQYCSAWAVILGASVAKWTSPLGTEFDPDRVLIMICLAALVGGGFQ